MTIGILDKDGNPQTVQTLDDMAKGAGPSSSATLRKTTASDSPELALFGATTETAPTSDTGPSGLNGRLQRIAQRLSSMMTSSVGVFARLTDGTNNVTIKGPSTGAPLETDVAVVVSMRDALPPGPADPDNSTPTIPAGYQYESVAASQSDQIMGGTGAIGDTLAGVLITPVTTAAGAVSIKDGTGSAITIFNSGTLSDLKPFFIPLNIRSTGGAWKITTGANVTALGVGIFSA